MKCQFGEVLAKYRREKKLTVRKLAEMIGLSPSQISEIETGRRLPPKKEEILRKMAFVLGIDADNFIKSAQEERIKKDSFLFRKLDSDLAWGFYRAVDNADQESLGEELRKFISNLEKKKNKGE